MLERKLWLHNGALSIAWILGSVQRAQGIWSTVSGQLCHGVGGSFHSDALCTDVAQARELQVCRGSLVSAAQCARLSWQPLHHLAAGLYPLSRDCQLECRWSPLQLIVYVYPTVAQGPQGGGEKAVIFPPAAPKLCLLPLLLWVRGLDQVQPLKRQGASRSMSYYSSTEYIVPPGCGLEECVDDALRPYKRYRATPLPGTAATGLFDGAAEGGGVKDPPEGDAWEPAVVLQPPVMSAHSVEMSTVEEEGNMGWGMQEGGAKTVAVDARCPSECGAEAPHVDGSHPATARPAVGLPPIAEVGDEATPQQHWAAACATEGIMGGVPAPQAFSLFPAPAAQPTAAQMFVAVMPESEELATVDVSEAVTASDSGGAQTAPSTPVARPFPFELMVTTEHNSNPFSPPSSLHFFRLEMDASVDIGQLFDEEALSTLEHHKSMQLLNERKDHTLHDCLQV
jgi:hypothetical protein